MAAKASYQIIQWNNFYQTFSSAIASKTGPAVSTGGGFQAIQFEQQGQIAYADKAIEKLKSNGQFNDFLPGVLDPFKSDKGYVAVPWQLDMRVFWYRKSLFEKANVALPTDWPSLLEAGKALKKVGAFGFTTGAGAGNNYANHSMIMMMVNNGGGVFNKDGELDLLNDRNVPSLGDLDVHCRERIAGYKVPRHLAVVDEMVRSPAGKADYGWAREVATNATP